jgi:CheY-like chemotaxis protein
MPVLDVLIADDNSDCLESMARLMRLLGCTVRKARCGTEALREAERHRPRLILVDMKMPCMDGFELVRRLRQSASSAAMIVAISGMTGESDKRRASEAGVDRYLVKPVAVGALEELIRKLSGEAQASKREAQTSKRLYSSCMDS